MADLILQIAVSLDGYIEDANGSLDFMEGDTSLDAVHTATLQSIDGMIFGRTAHALLAQFWPTAGEAGDAGDALVEQAELMNALPKYVLTHGKDTHGWTNSHPVTAEDVARLKRGSGRPLALYAGAGAASALMDQVDEVRLIQYPVLLGGGTRLFRDGDRRALGLVESRTFSSGVSLLRYRLD
jgi:dihydrofolate reductase